MRGQSPSVRTVWRHAAGGAVSAAGGDLPAAAVPQQGEDRGSSSAADLRSTAGARSRRPHRRQPSSTAPPMCPVCAALCCGRALRRSCARIGSPRSGVCAVAMGSSARLGATCLALHQPAQATHPHAPDAEVKCC